jgi:hypothetical protein
LIKALKNTGYFNITEALWPAKYILFIYLKSLINNSTIIRYADLCYNDLVNPVISYIYFNKLLRLGWGINDFLAML